MSEQPLSEIRGRRSGQMVFAAVFVAAAVILLALIRQQTTWLDGKELAAQPRFWPAVALSMMAGFGALHFWHLPRRPRWTDERREVIRWVRPLEYALWFMGFVWVVPVVGFLPASVVFAPFLTWRLGYRDRRVHVAAAIFAVVVVIVFKGLLSVRIPGGAVYEYLPGALRSFAILWL